jgi:hypothetical protein
MTTMDADATPLLPRGALEDDGATRERDERGRRRWRRGVAIAALFALGGCAAIASRDLGGRKATTDATTRDRDASEATGGERDDARTRTRTETRAGRRAGRSAGRGTRDGTRDAATATRDARTTATIASTTRERGMWVDAVERVVAADAEDDAEGVETTAATRGRWIPTKARVGGDFDVGEESDDAGREDAEASSDADDAYEANATLRALDDEVWIENYGQAKRRRARAKFLRAHGVDPKTTSGTAAFAALGATRDDCPAAYFAPKVGAASLGGPGASELPEHFAKFSVHATKLAALADQIYILCTECSLGIPEDWRAKTSFVHGFRIDECLKTQGIDHWHKASFSHAHALMDAQKKQHKTVAIIEEDVITRDFADGGVGWRMLLDNLGHVRDTMRLEKDWRTIRVGYRAMFIDRSIESVSKLEGKETCPKDCRCEKKNAFTCIMRQSGCDMRSSDFYLVREAAYQPIIDKIYEGYTVDCEALREVPNQIYITPQLSFQGTLDLKLQTQIQMGEEFMQKCAVGATA